MPKILIVDDQQLIRTILKDILLKGGYSQILEAENGDDAVDLYSKENPDLVLMDLVMPAGSGINAISNIIAKNPRAKIIVISSIGAEITMKRAMQLGAIGYLIKPIKDDKVVLDAVEKAFGGTKTNSSPLNPPQGAI